MEDKGHGKQRRKVKRSEKELITITKWPFAQMGDREIKRQQEREIKMIRTNREDK